MKLPLFCFVNFEIQSKITVNAQMLIMVDIAYRNENNLVSRCTWPITGNFTDDDVAQGPLCSARDFFDGSSLISFGSFSVAGARGMLLQKTFKVKERIGGTEIHFGL